MRSSMILSGAMFLVVAAGVAFAVRRARGADSLDQRLRDLAGKGEGVPAAPSVARRARAALPGIAAPLVPFSTWTAPLPSTTPPWPPTPSPPPPGARPTAGLSTTWLTVITSRAAPPSVPP
jgi:hypothetical protein